MTAQEKAEAIDSVRKEIQRSVLDQAFLWNRFFSYVKITGELNNRRNDPIEEVVIIKSSKLQFYILAFFICVFSFLLAYLLHKWMVLFYIPFFIPIFWCMQYVGSYSEVKEIVINRDGIACDKALTPWSEILQTFTGAVRLGRGEKRLLFIALTNGGVLEYDISNFAFNKIGHTIEHYKRIHVDQTFQN
jgi:hypothetical protein